MVYRALLGSERFILGLKPSSAVVSVDDRLVAAWDRAGRLYSLVRDDHTFRRGLNGRILEKWQAQDGPRKRWVEGASAAEVVSAASALAARAVDALERDRFGWDEAPEPGARDELALALERAAGFDPAAADEDAQRFAEVYQPIGILPPDQYLSLVVQATEGCSFGECTFCALYDRPYRVKSVDEFERHVRDVKAFLGQSITLRGRSVFLGAANALAVPMARLVPVFEILARELDTASRGVYAFVDAFTGSLKDAGDYQELAALGLRRVYIGLESGHDPLLEFVRKPGSSADAVETVRAIKAGGVRVGVIVMIGLGGHEFADLHARDTAVALGAMNLDSGDLVYFSDLVEQPGTAYPSLANARVMRPLSRAERVAQREAIRRATFFPDEPPRLATYDITEFVY